MSKLDVKQINLNRRVMEDSTIESPYNAVLEDSDCDLPEQLFDRMPPDNVGHLPKSEKNRSK